MQSRSGRTSAVAAAVVLLVAGCASTGEDVGSVSPSRSSSPPATAAPTIAAGTYLIGGLDTDQPCTATTADLPQLEHLGIALQEVAAMTVDPEELGLTGDDWYRSSEFADNYLYETQWPPACEAAKTLGRVTGHQQRAAFVGSEESTYKQVQIDVHLFQTEAGADAWLTWFPDAPSGSDEGAQTPSTNGRTVEPLSGLGDRAIRITSKDVQSEGSVIVLRLGPVVGDVYVWGDAGEPPVLDARDVASRLAARIASVTPTGVPYDVVDTMSSPLPLSAWGAPFEGWTWDWAGYSGGRDNATFIDSAEDPQQARRLVEEYGRLVGYQGTYGAPSGPGWIATGITTYRDAASASGAMQQIVADLLAPSDAGGARAFDIPAVPGSVGIVRTTGGEGGAQLVTEAYFLHGAALARVFDIQQESQDETDNRPLVIDMTQEFDKRLDALLDQPE
jgi:hypothetical protein